MKNKTKEEILNQVYMSAYDLKELMPSVGINKCRSYIDEVREDMESQELLVPPGKPKIALTKLIKKKLGL